MRLRKPENRWFIAFKWAGQSSAGLYTGANTRTRNQAIREHVHVIHGPLDVYYTDRPLTDVERQQWKECKKRGDKCVRLPIRVPSL